MSKEIGIYLLHFRRQFLDISLTLLNQMSDDNKKKIKLYILTQPYNRPINIPKLDIDHEVVVFDNYSNYLQKIKFANRQPHKYSIKLDEDIFLSANTWNHFIESISVLDDDSNLTFAPLLQNGVPTVDDFIRGFFNDEEKRSIHSFFLQTKIGRIANLISPGYQGDDYIKLNKYTLLSDEWRPYQFYDDVWKIPHFYKGIHPIRINFEAQKYILDWIINHFDTFLSSQPTIIETEYRYPYFCNSVFAIRSDVWREIMDPVTNDFDEVPINQHAEKTGKVFAFLEGVYGIHTMYSNVCESPSEYNPHASLEASAFELEFCNQMRKLLNIGTT